MLPVNPRLQHQAMSIEHLYMIRRTPEYIVDQRLALTYHLVQHKD
jgi:hypothetical protein